MNASDAVKFGQHINEKGAEGFLLWLRRDLPDVFAKVREQVPVVQQWEAQRFPEGLGFWGALFSGLGTALTQALPTITQVAGSVAVSKANKRLVDAQARLAAAQSAPMQTVAVVDPNTGAVAYQVPVNPGSKQSNAAIQASASWLDGYTFGIKNKSLIVAGVCVGLLTWLIIRRK